MDNIIAHDIESSERTNDVKIDESVTFSTMLLPDDILKGLHSAGFKTPSPIQLAAIPRARCGLDLIVQAKSGTGKTLVFAITALESVNISSKRLQAIIIAPTKEIVIQIADVIASIATNIKGLKVSVLVGGRPPTMDKPDLQGCHIAVGCPGRLRHLIELNYLDSQAVRLLVLDEADKLFDEGYQKDITFIYNKCGESKQVMALSATYPPQLVEFTQRYMRCGTHVTPAGGPTPVLLGLRQMLLVTKDHPDYNARMAAKEKELLHILETVPFDQCCIFNFYTTRAESMNNLLRKRGFASMCLTGKMCLEERKETLNSLKSNRCRILVTTDVAARGIDAASINLVINMSLPWDPASYLHRIGRAGRYGSQGLCISLISDGLELKKFQKLLGRIGGTSMAVNLIPRNKKSDLWNDDLNGFRKLYGILPDEGEEIGDENDGLSIEEYERNAIANGNNENSKPNKNTFEKVVHERKIIDCDEIQNNPFDTRPRSRPNTTKEKKKKNFPSFKQLEKEINAYLNGKENDIPEVHKKTPRKPASPKQKKATYSEILCRPKTSRKSLSSKLDNMIEIISDGVSEPKISIIPEKIDEVEPIDGGHLFTSIITKKGIIKKNRDVSSKERVKDSKNIKPKRSSLTLKDIISRTEVSPKTEDTSNKDVRPARNSLTLKDLMLRAEVSPRTEDTSNKDVKPKRSILTLKDLMSRTEVSPKTEDVKAKRSSLIVKDVILEADGSPKMEVRSNKDADHSRDPPGRSSLSVQVSQTDNDISLLNESRKNKRKRDAQNYSTSSSDFLSNSEDMYDEDPCEDDSPSGVDLNQYVEEINNDSISNISSEEDYFNNTRMSCPHCKQCVSHTCGSGRTTDWFAVISRQINYYVMYRRRFQSGV